MNIYIHLKISKHLLIPYFQFRSSLPWCWESRWVVCHFILHHKLSCTALSIHTEPTPYVSTAVEPSRRSTRQSKPLIWLQDFVTTSKDNACAYSITNKLSYSHLSQAYNQMLKAYPVVCEPASFHEVVSDPTWVKAMELEIEDLESNKTWNIIDLPPGKKPIGCRWIYKIKYLFSGEIERYKARLVANGFS